MSKKDKQVTEAEKLVNQVAEKLRVKRKSPKKIFVSEIEGITTICVAINPHSDPNIFARIATAAFKDQEIKVRVEFPKAGDNPKNPIDRFMELVRPKTHKGCIHFSIPGARKLLKLEPANFTQIEHIITSGLKRYSATAR